MAVPMTYESMPGMDRDMNGFEGMSNEDLNDLLDLSQTNGSAIHGMFDFSSGGIFTPNGINVNGAMAPGSFGENDMYQPRSMDAFAQYTSQDLPSYDSSSAGFPFAEQVDPAIIMGSTQPSNTVRQSKDLKGDDDGQSLASGESPVSSSGTSKKHSQEPEDAQAPKPKRTRVSKKKKLTPEQEEKKRREFLERNRQAASKCRARKQDANAALQEKVSTYGHANEIMKAEVAVLREIIAELKKSLSDHTNCADPQLKVGMQHLLRDTGSPETPLSAHSFGSIAGQLRGSGSSTVTSPEMDVDVLNSNPASPAWGMQRAGSEMSTTKQDTDGPYLSNVVTSPYEYSMTEQEFSAMPKQPSKTTEDDMGRHRETNGVVQEEHEMVMNRQNLRSRKCESRSSSSDLESFSNASTNTTPEASAREFSSLTPNITAGTRRGIPQKTLQNPRASLLTESMLPGVSPSEYLTHQ